ncbi:MAG: hypothetical protein ACREL3_11145 [Gemmatimonadales bacterium]
MVSAQRGVVSLALAGLLACAHRAEPEPVWPVAVEGQPRDVLALAGEAPYRDEQRRCWVDTWFTGRLIGDRLEGSFFAHPAVGDTVRIGTWWATRAP